MNHVYRTVFNRARGIYQVASELARNSGGGATSTAVAGTAPEARNGSVPGALRLGVLAALAVCGPQTGLAQVVYQYGTSGAGVAATNVAGTPRYGSGAGGIGGGGGGGSSAFGEGGAGGGTGGGAGGPGLGNGGNATVAGAVITGTAPPPLNNISALYIGGSGGGGSGAFGGTGGGSGGAGTAGTINLPANGQLVVAGELRVGGAGGGAGGGNGNGGTGGNGGDGGNGTLTLGANTVVNAGTLQVGGTAGNPGTTRPGTAGAGGTGVLQINGAGSLSTANGIAISSTGTIVGAQGTGSVFTLSGAITGAGKLTQSGAGTTVLLGNASYTGITTISAGTLQLGLGGAAGNFAGNITNNSKLLVNSNNTATISGAISGNGTLTRQGTGTTILSGANSYTGATTITGGTLQVGAGGATGTLGNGGNVVNSGALVFNRTGTLTVNNVISGAGTVTQAGTGTTVLTRNNTYTGATTISAGTLQVGDGGNAGTLGSAVAVTNNGTLAFNRSDAVAVGNVIGGTGAVSFAGGGTFTLTGANTYAGTTTVTGGILQVGAGGTLGTLGAGAVINNDRLVFNRSDARTIGNAIGGTGAVTVLGGAVTFTGLNSYAGLTTIGTPGTTVALRVGAGGTIGTLGTGDVVIARAGSSLTFNRSDALLVTGAISGQGTVTQAGAGTTTLTGASIYTGGTTVQAGTLALSGAGSLAAAGAVALSNAGTKFDISAASVGTRTVGALTGVVNSTIALGGNTLAFGTVANQTISSVIGGSGGSIVKQGAGVVTLSGANTYTGATTINAGTLSMGVVNALSKDTSVVLANAASAKLDLNSLNQSIGSLADGGGLGGNVVLGTANLSVGGNGTSTSYDGVVSGTGGVTKVGAGTQTLTRSNTYTGGTAVQAGTLALSGAGSLAASGALTLSAGAKFDIAAASGGSRTVGALSGAGSSTIALGVNALTFGDATAQTFAGVIGGTGGIVKQGAAVTTLSGANTYTGATTVNVGTLRMGAANALSGGTAVVLANAAGASLDLAGFNQSIGSLAGGGATGGNVTLGTGNLGLGGNGSSTSYAGVISGTGGVTKTGAGIQTFAAANTYTGGTTVQAGTLALSGAGNLDAGSTVALSGAGASFNISAAATDRTVGALVGVAGSTVALGARTLTFGNATNQTFAGVAAGTGGLAKQGTGTVALTGVNTYTGATTINAGTLAVNGSVAGNVQVNNGGTLGGTGSIGGNVAVGSGATLSAGNSPGTLTVAGNLALAAGSTSVFELGQSGAIGGVSNDLVNVGGNLTLGGSLQATASSAGFYRLFNYGVTNPAATLSGSFATTNVAGVGGFTAASQQVSGTAASLGNPGQVNLSVLGAGQNLQFWNGSTNKAGGTSVVGGTGTWDGFGTNWTDAQGSTATNWAGSVGVFAGAAGGKVTVQGPQSFDTLQFSTDGYNLVAGTNGTLGLAPSTGTSGTLNTDAGINASISAAIVNGPGTGTGLVKVGSGTLTLSGANTYTGGTTVNEGILVAAGNSALGTGAAVVDNTSLRGATLQVDKGVTLANAITLNNGGTLDNAGTLDVVGTAVQGLIGTGTVRNRAGSTINGSDVGVSLQAGSSIVNEAGATIGGGIAAVQGNGTLLNAGTLQGNVQLDAQAANAVTLQTTGQIVGDLSIGNAASTLTLDTDAAARLHSQAVTGTTTFTGVLAKTGTGTWVLDRDLAAARTTIDAGTLQLGDGGTTGTVGNGAITNNATLVVNRSNGLTLAGAIDGAGALVKQGAGTLALTGANSYTGGTSLKQGRIDLGHNQALGTGALAMDDGTTLGFTADGLLVANAIRMTGNNDPVIDTGAFSETLSGVISGAGFLTKDGTGKLTLTGDNTYTGTTTISAGTLQIGNGGTTGMLGTGAVTNAGALVFQRSDALAVTNAIGGSGSLTQAGSGTLTLGGVNTYTGATLVNAGTLRAGMANTFSAASAHTVATGATLDLAGFNQTVAGVTNAGTVNLRGSAPGTVLTVTGPWVGQGGTLAMGTALGGNASASDKLVLSGPGAVASGTTRLQVTNLGGLGGQTTGSGLALVSTENGASVQANAFSLTQPVSAGAYEYRLNTDAGGAYLNSTSTTPVPGAGPMSGATLYRAEVPLLAALPEQLRQANLAMLGNVHQRMGDDGAAGREPGARQAWGRILTVDRSIQQSGTVSPSSEGRLTGFQAGTDLWATPAWRAGVYVGRLEGDMKVSGFARGIAGYAAGANDLKNDYLGGYVGYRADSGLYLDGVLQAGRHRATIGTSGTPAGSSKGNSLLASLEVGQSFAMGGGWSLEPQLQLVHQRLNLQDSALVGATVQQDVHNGWAVRAGLRVKGEFSVGAGTLQPYARLNVWHTGSGTDRARFIGPAAFADIATSTGGTSTEAAVGATWQISPAVGVYGELGQMWASGGSTRTKGGPNASLGVKVRW